MNTVLSGMDEDAHMNHLKFTRMSDTDYEYAVQGLNKEQHDVFSTIHRGSSMSAYVLLILLNKLGKRDKM